MLQIVIYHGNTYIERDFVLTQIPRYANFTEHYVSDAGLNSISIKWNANVECDAVQYSLSGRNWISTSGLNYTIYNLTPNTQYSIRTRIRRADSGLWTESGYVYSTTKDIAKISSVVDFEHGANSIIGITNPARNIKFEFKNVSKQQRNIF